MKTIIERGIERGCDTWSPMCSADEFKPVSTDLPVELCRLVTAYCNNARDMDDVGKQVVLATIIELRQAARMYAVFDDETK